VFQTEFFRSLLEGALRNYGTVDSSGNIINPQLSQAAFDYLQSAGFISSAEAVKWGTVILTGTVGGEVVITVTVAVAGGVLAYEAVVALHDWWMARRGNSDPVTVAKSPVQTARDANGFCQSPPKFKWKAKGDEHGAYGQGFHWHWQIWNLADPATCTWYYNGRGAGPNDPGPEWMLIPGIF
jgi:hypothetical protein